MTTIDTDTTELLAAGFSGNLLRPGDATYDEARQVYNAMFDRHPALIVQCRNTEDVVAAVKFARGGGSGGGRARAEDTASPASRRARGGS